MLTQKLESHGLAACAWWPDPHSTGRAQEARSLLERQYRAFSYGTGQPGAAGRRRGVIKGGGREPLALYVRLLYGDGIFYCRGEDGSAWLLVIHQGAIVPGSDCMVCPLVFETLMAGRAAGPYAGLPLRELGDREAEEILARCQESRRRQTKQRYLLYAAAACLALALLGAAAALILTG